MNKALSILVGIFLLTVPALQAQQDSTRNYKHELTVKWGYHLYKRQDLVFSPMIYSSGHLSNVEVRFDWRKPKTLNSISVQFDKPALKWHDPYTYKRWPDEVEEQTIVGPHTMLNIRYHKLWPVGKPESGWYLGFVSDNQLNAFDFGYGHFGVFGYQMNFSLGPKAQWSTGLGERGTVKLSGQIAALSWLARSAYAAHDDEYFENNADHKAVKTLFRYIGDGEFGGAGKFGKVNLEAEYGYALTDRWTASISYELESLYFSKPRSLNAYRHNFNIGITWKF